MYDAKPCVEDPDERPRESKRVTTQAPVNEAETFADVFNAICDNIEVTIEHQW